MVAQIESTVSESAGPGPPGCVRLQPAALRGFDFLKRTDRLDDLMAKSVALPDGRGHLVPA